MCVDVFMYDHDSFERLMTVVQKLVANTNLAISLKKHQLFFYTRLQSLFNLRFDRKDEQALFEIMLEYAISAERMSPGGFDAFFQRLNKNSMFVKPDSCRATRKNVDALVERYCDNNKELYNMINEALSLSGFGGRVVIERTNGKQSVELLNGYTFSLFPALKLTQKTFFEPRMVCIDGFIESVSEVHRLLSDANESKTPIFVFVRGISDDVLNTLSVNFNRGTLNVFPVIVPYDFAGINLLKDLAVVIGCDVVSSNKGQLISSITLNDCVVVDRVNVLNKQIVILNKHTKNSVVKHVKLLREKSSDEQTGFTESLMNARIKSLSPNQVCLRLKDDIEFVVKSQTIDYILRSISSMIRGGVLSDGITPYLSVVGADFYHKQFMNSIRNMGALIIK